MGGRYHLWDFVQVALSSPVRNAFLHFLHLISRSISNGPTKKKKRKKKNTKPQPAWPHGLLQHPCISTRWWLKRVLQKKHLVWLGGSKPLIWFHLNHHFLTGEGERLFVQSEDEPGESSRDRWMLDITNYIPVMRFQGAKRNHLNGSKQEGAMWFWQRFLQGSDSQRCKATSSGNER